MDLYIPPEALEIFLEAFEGPLDLLLYLIRRQNFNVLDVPMASLTAQYLEYVERIRSTNLELAADYLLMAAVLIEIKSRMLLPRPRREDAVEEDPRAALVRRLLEYEQFKLAAQGLQDLPVVGREFDWVELWIEREMTAPQPRVEVADLLGAWRQLLRQAQLYQHHRVRREELSVREFMSNILQIGRAHV